MNFAEAIFMRPSLRRLAAGGLRSRGSGLIRGVRLVCIRREACRSSENIGGSLRRGDRGSGNVAGDIGRGNSNGGWENGCSGAWEGLEDCCGGRDGGVSSARAHTKSDNGSSSLGGRGLVAV